MEIWIDSGDRPLAAYQLELTYDRAAASLVGVEGGDGPFSAPPYYDPRGLTAGRVVLAAFTTQEGPPKGRVRVARVHLEERAEARLAVRLTVAGTVGGDRIPATIEMNWEGGGVR